jgi:hypothetical protein
MALEDFMESFNFDLSGLMSTATSIFNSFAPIFLAIAGISLGLGLLIKVVSEIRHAF